ncbi:MAG: hypothetical protein ACK5LR_09685, partial [Mangrovibacterium sp.]
GANSILKGKNAYVIKGESDYSGRVKPSDSELVKAVKQLNKISFISSDKGNVSRLIELTDIMISNLDFNGNSSLAELQDVKQLLSQYNEKYRHGRSLISDDYQDKSMDYLQERRAIFEKAADDFNEEARDFIITKQRQTQAKKKSKKKAALLAIPALGLQWAYLGSPGYTYLSIVLCWTIIVPIINLIALLKLLLMSEAKFDAEYNPELVYYRQFKVGE